MPAVKEEESTNLKPFLNLVLIKIQSGKQQFCKHHFTDNEAKAQSDK